MRFLDTLVIGARIRMSRIVGTVAAALFAFAPIQALAAPITAKDVLEDGEMQNAMKDGGSLKPFSEKVDDIGGGSYHIGYKIGIVIGVLSLIATGIGFLVASASERKEQKDKFVMRVIGIIIIVAAIGLVTFLATSFENLFDVTGSTN